MIENVKPKRGGKLRVADVIPFFGMIFVIVLFSILTRGMLLQPSNLPNLISSCFMLTLASVAATFVFSRGGLDFSIGSLQGMCIVLTALIVTGDIGNAWLALVVCVLTGAAVGFLNGAVQAYLGIPAFVTTLAVSYILRGIINTVQMNVAAAMPIAFASVYSVPVCLIVLVAVIGVTFFLFEYTRFGKVCKLLGENPRAVRFNGTSDRMYVIFTHVFLCVAVGVGAYMIAPRFTLVQATVGAGLELDVMIACMIGGMPMSGGIRSKVSRPVIGSVIISVLNQSYTLMNIETSYVQVTKGVLFIVIIAITTPGALSGLRRVGKKRQLQQ